MREQNKRGETESPPNHKHCTELPHIIFGTRLNVYNFRIYMVEVSK